MKGKLLLITVLFACVFASASSISNSDDWDYLLMISRWGQTVCETSSRSCTIFRNVTDFTLHGLWANRNDTSGPAFCDKSDPFDLDKVYDLVGDLKRYWTDFFTPEKDGLYKHEWEKHGTCSKSDYMIREQHDFFSKGLSLKKEYDLVSTLANYGTVPGDGSFAPNDFIKPINESYGVTPLLFCQQYHGKKLLLHVRFCISKALDLFECDDAEKKHVEEQGSCGDEFYWHPLEYNYPV